MSRGRASWTSPAARRKRCRGMGAMVVGLLVAGTVVACGGHELTAVGALGGDARPDRADAFGGAGRTDAADSTDAAESFEDATVDVDAASDGNGVSDATDTTDATDGPRRAPYRVLALAVGKYHTCALLDDHNVKCWGYNGLGELGLGDTRHRGATVEEMGDALPVVDLGRGRTAKFIAAGRYATCAILDNDVTKCWGWSSLIGQSDGQNRGDQPGEMGDNLPAMNLGGLAARRVGMTSDHACALLNDGSVSCWQGGQPTTRRPAASPGVVDLTNAWGMCAVFDDGTVGRLPGILSGAFSVGDQRVRFVAGYDGRACAALRTGGWGCWSTIDMITLRSSSNPVALSIGLGHSCALLEKGEVRCTGPLKPETWKDETAPITDDGGLVRLPKSAIALSNGGEGHTCAILADQSVRCWGWPVGHPILGGTAPTTTGWPAIDLGSHVVDQAATGQ